jgi:TPR repeat protein
MDGETIPEEAVRAALMAAARARLQGGDAKFTIKAICEEAGASRQAFQHFFAGKQALLAALMEPVPAAPAAVDPWLERRLRVFERALTALEAKAETAAREQALAMARLEERLAGVAAPPAVMIEAPATAAPQDPVVDEAAPEAQVEVAVDAVVAALEPPSEPAVSRDEMAAFLETARRAARDAEERRAAQEPRRASPLRSLAVAGLALITTLAICAVMTLGHAARAPLSGSGVSHRHLASGRIAQLVARGDSGDRAAQAELALAYLRGQGVAADDAAAARWAHAAALKGDDNAQYVLGSLYACGQGVAADPAQAFFWFQAAARHGHVKAMHNLGIAYVEGQGTAKDAALAAQWFARAARQGYRDSAFDLGVLYERGLGVPQSPVLAAAWYGRAAAEGDGPAAQRLALLNEEVPR